MRIIARGVCALLLAVLIQGEPLQAITSCEGLASLALPNATITLAKPVDAGAFVPPGGGGRAAAVPQAFCRIAATLKPSSDSDIKIELWMPASNWNGKFQ